MLGFCDCRRDDDKTPRQTAERRAPGGAFPVIPLSMPGKILGPSIGSFAGPVSLDIPSCTGCGAAPAFSLSFEDRFLNPLAEKERSPSPAPQNPQP